MHKSTFRQKLTVTEDSVKYSVIKEDIQVCLFEQTARDEVVSEKCLCGVLRLYRAVKPQTTLRWCGGDKWAEVSILCIVQT